MTNKTCGECKHYIAEMYHCSKNDVMADCVKQNGDHDTQTALSKADYTESEETE